MQSITDILLEIGTEEIPARFLPGAITQLKEIADARFKDNAIVFKEIYTTATPNRLSLIAGGVNMLQESRVKEYYGPPKVRAYDKSGKPAKAAIGFANSHGIGVESLVIKTKGKGEYVVAVIEEKGAALVEIIDSVLLSVINSLKFPKSMRWGSGSFKFARPIKWITAVMGSKPIHFTLNDINATATTYGHRFLSNKALTINDIGNYKNLLRENKVIVDFEERKTLIKKQMEEKAGSVNASVIEDNELLDTVNFLVEYPNAVVGAFSEDFTALPKELLISVMRDHQKYFALEDDEFRMTNKFIIISNTAGENSMTVKSGAERVLTARFDDARFYYEEDLKIPLIDRLDSLKGVMFHKDIGTMHEKVERIGFIAEMLLEKLNAEGQPCLATNTERIGRAVRLSKNDLTTGVVREFPELQGAIGRYYSLHDREEREIALSLEEQYLPAFAGDSLPVTDTGVILSLADKLDNIVSFFSVNLVPTGSEDPYALRRQANGIVLILLHRGFAVSLSIILRGIPDIIKRDGHIPDNLKAFFKQRLESHFSSLGYANDVVNAAMYDFMDIPLLYLNNRLDALGSLKGKSGYNDFLFALKRVHNIIPPGFEGETDEESLDSVYEKELLEKTKNISKGIHDSTARGDYNGAFAMLEGVIGSINTFFDKVLVMDKDERKRNNKLSILASLHKLAGKAADFSALEER